MAGGESGQTLQPNEGSGTAFQSTRTHALFTNSSSSLSGTPLHTSMDGHSSYYIVKRARHCRLIELCMKLFLDDKIALEFMIFFYSLLTTTRIGKMIGKNNETLQFQNSNN
jgi:hypothetical protein